MSDGTGVIVKGQAELVRAFTRASNVSDKYIRQELAKVAEPIAKGAEFNAVEEIRNIGTRWSRMRVGVTQKLIYVVPAQSGGRGPATRRRPNIFGLLDRAMTESFDEHEGEIMERVDEALERIEEEWAI